MTTYYKINFVEKSICVKKDIIRQIPYFNNMIKGCEIDFEEIDVPRMGFLFDHVLAFVVSPLYPYPVEYYDELDFYDISYDKQKLFDKNKIQLDIITNIVKNNHQSTVFPSLKCICFNESSINRTYILCKTHINRGKCKYNYNGSLCKLPTDKYNFCDVHQNYDLQSTTGICKKLGCGLIRMDNKYYCYLHNDQNI